jgi:type III secretion system needle length determinant
VHHPQPQTSASGDSKDTIRNTDKSQSASADQAVSAMPQAGDHILNTLTGPGSAPTGVDKQTNNQPAAIDNERAFAIADRLADRILVSDRSLSSDSAVRIQLRDSVLGGAEIAISRDQGQIVVAFHLRDDHADHQLSAQLGNLQQHLEDRLKQPVRIEVSVAGDGAGDGAGDQGRSRNRRDLWDEWQNRES